MYSKKYLAQSGFYQTVFHKSGCLYNQVPEQSMLREYEIYQIKAINGMRKHLTEEQPPLLPINRSSRIRSLTQPTLLCASEHSRNGTKIILPNKLSIIDVHLYFPIKISVVKRKMLHPRRFVILLHDVRSSDRLD